jgi:O-antigen ligase
MRPYISKTISTVVILTLSWGGLNLFGSDWLLISILASFLLMPPMILSKRFYFTKLDLIFFAFLITLVISGIQHLNDKTINYLLAWMVGFYYYLYRVPIFIADTSNKSSLDMSIACGAIVIASISIMEQILYFSSGYILFFDLPRFDYDHANYMGIVYRSFAFSNEPSNLAYYLLLTLPFVIRALGKFAVIFVIVGIVPSFSASGYALGFLALSCVTLHKMLESNGKIFFLYFLLGVLILPTLLKLSFQIELLGKIFDKVLFSSSDLSASLRLSRIFESIEVFKSNPLLGVGPGFWSSNSDVSPNNIFLLVLTEAGLLGLLFFLMFLFGLCFSGGGRILRISSTQIYLIVVGLGFGFFTGVSFSLIGVFLITLYNTCRASETRLLEPSQSFYKVTP